ncbi:MAG: F0F1 ATP synthase subunit A [Planctomycetota bacterium]
MPDLTALTMMLPLAAGDDPVAATKDHWFEPFGFPLISNHIIMMLVAAAIMLAVFIPMAKRYREDKELVPTGKSNFFEAIMLYLRDEVVKPVLGEATNRYIPLLWTLFFFILFLNLLGLLPLKEIQLELFAAMGLQDTLYPVYGLPTANIYVTAALALVAFVVIQIAGIKANGLGGYLHHYLGGAPLYMAPIIVPVEIMGTFIKPSALAIRLFANMVGGKMLLFILTGLAVTSFDAVGTAGGIGVSIAVIGGSVAISVLKVFVSFLQAYIFMFLTALFIGLLVVHEEHDEHGEHEEDHDLAVDLDDAAQLDKASVAAGVHAAG